MEKGTKDTDITIVRFAGKKEKNKGVKQIDYQAKKRNKEDLLRSGGLYLYGKQ